MAATDLLNATILSREDFTRELCVMRIGADAGVVPTFEPGQFITVGLPKDVDPPPVATDPTSPRRPSGRPRMLRRAYSIASSADQRDHIELYLVLVKEGRFTPKLWAMDPGDKLWMDNQAKGEFTLRDVESDRDLVMVSTGTGLAPYLSMLRSYRGRSRWRRCVIIHGVRLVEDLGYRQELEAASRDDPSVIYLPTVTREPADSSWSGLRGRVPKYLEPQAFRTNAGFDLDPASCHVFLCGNPDMIHDVEALLHSLGFTTHTRKQSGNIHFERYW